MPKCRERFQDANERHQVQGNEEKEGGREERGDLFSDLRVELAHGAVSPFAFLRPRFSQYVSRQ